MRVLVVGTTGVLGRNVLPRLVERGHSVRAIARRPEQVEHLRRLGVDALAGDILDTESLHRAVAGCEAALHLATAIPKAGGAQDWTRNDQIRREGTRNLLAAAQQNGVQRYLQQSITFLYGDHSSTIVDERTAVRPSPYIQSAADMEALVRASSLEWCILRGGSFYGPGTGKEDGWREAARNGTLQLPAERNSLVSLIHVVDMARAVVLAMEHARSQSTYNVVDDQPVTYRELYGYVAAQMDLPAPTPGSSSTQSLGCSNRELKAALGWEPAYPSYRSGLAEC